MFSWTKRIISGRVGVWYQQRQLNKYLDNDNKVDKVTRKEAKEVAKKLYIDYYNDSTSLKIGKVDKYASDKIVQELNEKFANTKIPYSQKVIWDVKDLKVTLINFAIGFVPPPISKDYIQATVKFTSKQQLKVVNKEDGQIVSGSEEYFPTEEIWVIEKEFSKDSKWYINTTKAEMEIVDMKEKLNKRV